jgi:hypothetical protein
LFLVQLIAFDCFRIPGRLFKKCILPLCHLFILLCYWFEAHWLLLYKLNEKLICKPIPPMAGPA